MKIYKMLKTIKENGHLFDSDNITVDYWSLNPEEGSEIVPIGGDKLYDKLYAIEYNTNKMNTAELLSIMFNKLSTADVKSICEEDPFIEKLFMQYLKNPVIYEKLFEKLRNTREW